MATKKLTTKYNLAELLKRVPPNQLKQFEIFRDKTLEYHRKVNQFPDKLPAIDWEYYRNNVRKDYVEMVEQFQVKYEELKHVFASRHEVLNHDKYYTELDQLSVEAEDEINEFVENSKNRVRVYQDELKRIKALNYENMTIEQFIEEREDLAQYIPGQGKALFWPHTAEEQVEEGDQVGSNNENNKKMAKKEEK